MPGSDFHLQDSDSQLLREMMQRIEDLEAQSNQGMPPGMIVPEAAPVRSPKWSNSHFEAVGSNYTHYYTLNDFNSGGIAADQTGNESFNGVLSAESQAALPIQGQPGGLTSDAGYSVYFAGKERSRIQLPLLSSLAKGWSLEITFNPQTLTQKALLFYNGTEGVDGYGLMVSNSTGTAVGSDLVITTPTTVIDTEITLVAEQWCNVVLTLNSSGTLTGIITQWNPVTKVITKTTISKALTITAPTEGAVIGAGRVGTGLEFKGWIDEVITWNGEMNFSTEIQGSAFDRSHTSLEPAAPNGFVKADGTVVSRAKYDRIFKRVGTINGAGDGVSTFSLPNMSTALTGLNINWLVKT